ncbi:MAG: hypothetical protein PHD67_04335 [Oscillospiraceae bacterium]|nr:hypothetical protein [Oscillospiraceae bacterium]
MEEKETARMRLAFRISLEEFTAFNLEKAEEMTAKKKKSSRLSGLLGTAVAVLVLIWLLPQPNFSRVILFLALFLLAFGVYQILYFPLLFPVMMRRSVQKAYGESRYLQNEIVLEFYDGYFKESSAEGEKKTRQKEVAAFSERPLYYQLDLKSGKSVLIPKKGLTEEERELLCGFFPGTQLEN